MGKLYHNYLNGTRLWLCNNCNIHLANHDEVISKSFHGRHGKAYLFNSADNVIDGKREERNLMTGRHIVYDVHCRGCNAVVGWRYEEAFEDSQKYKVGKFLLEKALMVKDEN